MPKVGKYVPLNSNMDNKKLITYSAIAAAVILLIGGILAIADRYRTKTPVSNDIGDSIEKTGPASIKSALEETEEPKKKEQQKEALISDRAVKQLGEDKKQIRKLILAFFEAIKQGKDLSSYFGDSSGEYKEDLVKRYGGSISDYEYYFTEKIATMSGIYRQELGRHRKIKIIEIVPNGYSRVFVKVCKEGFCKVFGVELVQNKEGQWNISDKDKIEGTAGSGGYNKKSTTSEPSRIARKLFILLNKGEDWKVRNLFPVECQEKVIEAIIKDIKDMKTIFSFFEKIEVVTEETTETMNCIILTGGGEDISFTECSIPVVKMTDGKWKVIQNYYTRCH